MTPLIAAIQLEVVQLAQVHGFSHEQTLKDCSIRELLLFLGTKAMATPVAPDDPPPEPEIDLEKEKRRFAASMAGFVNDG